MMTDNQRERYAQAYYLMLGELTTLEAMIADYPEPTDVIDPALAYEVADLTRQLNALTAIWTGSSA